MNWIEAIEIIPKLPMKQGWVVQAILPRSSFVISHLYIWDAEENQVSVTFPSDKEDRIEIYSFGSENIQWHRYEDPVEDIVQGIEEMLKEKKE